nr:MAG: hypothetical protein DIU64_09530 [Caldicoprobacter oshimai]
MHCLALKGNDTKYPLVATVLLLDLILTGNFLQRNTTNVTLYMAVFGIAVLLVVFVAWCFSKLSAFAVFTGLLILSPPVSIATTLPSIRFDEIMLVFLLIRLFYEDPYGFLKQNAVIIKLLFLIVAYGVISILHSFLFLNYIPSIGDFFEIARFIEYGIAVMVAKTVASNVSKKDMENFFNYFIFFSFVFILFCFYQFFNLFHFNGNISLLYTHELHVYALNKYRRVIGTVANPNSAGFFLNAIFFYLICRLFFLSQQERKAAIWAEALLAAGAFAALLCTLSRTNILANFVCLAWFIIFKSKEKASRWMKKVTLTLLIIGVAIVIAFFIFDESFRMRMISGFDIINDRSLVARFQRWAEVLQEIAQSPLLGWGPAKNLFDIASPVDNEYLLILRKYGIIGFCFYLLGYYLIYRQASAAEKLSETKWLGLFEKCIFLCFVITNITGGILYHIQIMPFLLVMITFASGIRRLCEYERIQQKTA